jgi:hypothetical protein
MLILWFSRKQLPPYFVQALPEGEVHSLIHSAVWAPLPEGPSPPRPGTIRALSPFVDMVLAEQYDDAGKQPHRQFLEFRRLWWLRTVEPVHHLLKLFPQEPVSSFPNGTHRFHLALRGRHAGSKNRDSPCSPPICLVSSVGGTQGRGHSDWAGDGGSRPDGGRTSSAVNPTLGPWENSNRWVRARTAQIQGTRVSSPFRFGVVAALLS